MAYTEAQWNKFQASLPPEDRVSYIDYIREADPAEYNRLISAAVSLLKAEGAEPTKATTVDERTKLAGAKTDTAAQKAATQNAAGLLSRLKADAAEPTTGTVVDETTKIEGAKSSLKTPAELEAERLAVEAKRLQEIETKTKAALAKFQRKEPLSAEEKALLNLGADFEYPPVPDGNNGNNNVDGKDPGKQPGPAWILNADKSAWVKPPQPNATDTWDDTKGWIPAVVKPTNLGKQPGAAWILNADKTDWIKPPQTNPTDTWDDEKGWVPAATGDKKIKNPGYWTDPTTGLLYKDDVLVEGDYGDFKYKAGRVIGKAGEDRPVGTPAAFVWDPVTKTWKMPSKPTDKGNWVFDPDKGWVDTDVLLGSGGGTATNERMLAINTFKNTLGLFFGAAEISKPWVDGLYKYVSGFYKTGSTIDESFNLALQEARFDPNLAEFTKRFKGVYALTDLKAKGGVVTVPTIAEYFATESAMGSVLESAGLGKLANEDFLGDIIGKNVSVTEFTNRITKVYDRIDSAPAELKSTFARFFPSIDRVTLATALLTGPKGAAELAKEVASYEIVSASEQQGLGIIDPVTGKRLGIGLDEAQNIAAQGYGYQAALTGFGQISQNLQPYEKLMEISSGKDVSTDDARKQLQDITFGKLASAQRKADQLAAEEEARFRGASGLSRGALTSQKYGLV